MSSPTRSHPATGSAPADPYREKNRDDAALSIQDKIEDLSAFMTACKFGMMVTRAAAGQGRLASRCMALAATETGGIDLIFHTNTESGKIQDLESDPHVNISFLNSAGDWASLSGQATIDTERATVRKYYTRTLKAWLGDLGDGTQDGGPEDPRLGVIRVRAETAAYALARKSLPARAVDIAQGAVTGRVPAVTKLRELSEEEIETWRVSRRMVQ